MHGRTLNLFTVKPLVVILGPKDREHTIVDRFGSGGGVGGDDRKALEPMAVRGLPGVPSPASPKTGTSPTVKRNAALSDLRSSRQSALPPTAPLRTVHESFQLTRLKPSKRLSRDAGSGAAELAVQLTVALGMEKLAVGCSVVAAQHLG